MRRVSLPLKKGECGLSNLRKGSKRDFGKYSSPNVKFAAKGLKPEINNPINHYPSPIP
jgi:hypothetical protein